MNFIREDIPSKLLNDDTFVSGIENLLVEIKLRFKDGLFRFFQPTFKFSLILISTPPNTRILLFWVVLTQK